MKKFFLAIFAMVYMGTSTGATLHLHYCMGKLADWGLGQSSSKTCGKCGMEKNEDNGCCKDEKKFIKNSADQKGFEFSFLALKAPLSLPVSFVEIPSIALFSALIEYPDTNSPPRSTSVAVYILNRTFRI